MSGHKVFRVYTTVSVKYKFPVGVCVCGGGGGGGGWAGSDIYFSTIWN